MPDAVNGHSDFKLGDFSVDEYQPLKVIVVGAGFSGICAGIRFRQRIQGVDLTIYDKNSGVGGVWYTNRYPGLACDIPSHCYQYTFEEKTDWSSVYAPGPEIRKYLQDVAAKYKLTPHIKLQHELTHARYDEPTAKWHVRIRRPVSRHPPPAPSDSSPSQTSAPAPNGTHDAPEYEEFEDTADILFTAFGGLSRWSWPDIEGLNDFKGRTLHTAKWDVEGATWQEGVKDWGDKKVAVIGVGSSAIQLVPALQPRVSRLVNYVRGRTWFSPPFASAKIAELLNRDLTSERYEFTAQDVEAFEKDPEYYKRFRRDLETDLNSTHLATIRGTALQAGARAAFTESMLTRLAKKPWIADHLLPEFAVACRRLTPGPGYLEALCEDNVEYVPTHIKRVTPTGIETVDGKHEEFDVIVCATGYDTTFQLPFPIVGRGGVDVRARWTPHPVTYLGVCVDGFPNWFFALGPNSAVGSGSLLVLAEQQVEYAVRAAGKMQRERVRSVEVRGEAVRDFDEYLEHYFPTSVYSEKCRSWYKMGKEEGRIAGLWPGSCLHAVRALRHPRWEDFTYEYREGIKNRMHWLGDGSTVNEKAMKGDRAWYLGDDYLDIPPVPSD